MSTPDPLFLDPGHADLETAVRALVDAFGLQRTDRDGEAWLGTSGPAAAIGEVGGRFEVNDWQGANDLEDVEVTASDVAILDDLPLVWMLRFRAESLDEQRRRAREDFDLVVDRVGWSAVLTHNFDALVAAYDPQRGVREFPPGTPADGTGRHL